MSAALKLHNPDDPFDPNSLRGAFERFKLPELQSPSPETVAEYRRFVGRWERFWTNPRPLNSRTATPGVAPTGFADVSRSHLTEWRNHLQSQGLTARNINKHLQLITAVLAAAVRADQLDAAPKLQPLPNTKRAAPKLYLDREQVCRIYDACDVAEWPTRSFRTSDGITYDRGGRSIELPFEPAAYWRCAVVLWFNFGLRTQELIRFESRHESLRWKNISLDAETPAQDGRGRRPEGCSKDPKQRACQRS